MERHADASPSQESILQTPFEETPMTEPLYTAFHGSTISRPPGPSPPHRQSSLTRKSSLITSLTPVTPRSIPETTSITASIPFRRPDAVPVSVASNAAAPMSASSAAARSETPVTAYSQTPFSIEPVTAPSQPVTALSQPMCQKKVLSYLYGESGPYQHHVFFFVMLVFFVMSLHTLVTPEFAPDIDYWCAKPADSRVTDDEWLEEGIPREEDGSLKKCYMFHINGSEVPCSSWVFKKNREYTRTLRDEWNLVCDREWLISLSNTVFFLGGMTTMPIMGGMSDKLGRQPVIYLNIFTALVSGCMMLAVRHFMSFLLCRFFLAFGMNAVYSTGITLLSEITEPEERAFMLMAGFLFWGIGVVTLWVISLYLDNWLIVQFIIMAPSLFLVSAFMVIMESPRWLIARRNITRAKKAIFTAALINGYKLPEIRGKWDEVSPELLKDVESVDPMETTSLGIFGLPGLRKVVSILWFSWFVNMYMYYTLKIRPGFEYNFLQGHVTSGLIELPAYLVAVTTINRLGRRPSTAICMLLGGLLSLPIVLLSGPNVMVEAANVACKVLIAAANSILEVHTSEVFPTVVRNTAFNACSVCGRCGAILATFTAPTKDSLFGIGPYLLFSIFCILDSALLMKLPETVNADLPDTIAEAQALVEHDKEDSKL